MTAPYPDGLTVRPITDWPEPRTPAHQRRAAPFTANGRRVPWTDTLDLLGRELRHLCAPRPVFAVLQVDLREQDFRVDGLPRATAKPTDDGVVITITAPAGTFTFPCDTFTHWQDNVRGIALALEALRKVDRYGVTRRSEQYAGWRALPATAREGASGDRAEAATLIATTAGGGGWSAGDLLTDPDLARRVARRALRHAHPDTGGTAHLFHRVQAAAATLTGEQP